MEKECAPDETQAICIRCGELNPERTSRCLKCKSPLDDFAASSPWEMGSATNSAYSSPTSPRTKPIIFWGVWVYFGPTVFLSLRAIYLFIKDHVTNPYAYPVSTTELLFILALPAGYSLLELWALWAVTKGYCSPTRNSDASPSS